jgi:hypothetical protein
MTYETGVDPAGTVLLAGSGDLGPPFSAWLMRRAPTGAYAEPESLAADERIERALVTSDGTLIAATTRYARDNSPPESFLRVRAAGGGIAVQPLPGAPTMFRFTTEPLGGALLLFTDNFYDDEAGPVLVTERAPGGAFGAVATLATGRTFPTAVALSASRSAVVAYRDMDAGTLHVIVRDAPGGLAAAAKEHLEALGGALEPVVDVSDVPPLPPAAPAVTVPVTCTETCEVTAALGARGRPVAGAAQSRRGVRLRPGRRTRVKVRLSGAGRRALRTGGRLTVGVRVRGYSQRVVTRRVRLRRAVRRAGAGR